MSKDAIILLSGGLDSVVSMVYILKNTDIEIKEAITFDYGQKTTQSEIEASKIFCKLYNVKHSIVKLDWLKDITKTALVSDVEIPKDGFTTKDSAKSVWVPNRNSLFLNIAACYCESYNYKYIVYGANKDEAENFSDNTEVFREQINKLFKYSTQQHPQVLAPLINYSKDDIVKIAVRDGVPLEFVKSCYVSNSKHCGICESCYHLKRALLKNGCIEYIDMLFGNEK